MSILVFFTICVSTCSFILSTTPDLQTTCVLRGEDDYDEHCRPHPLPYFEIIDLVCIMFFTFEYSARLLLSAFMRKELVDRDVLLTMMISDEVFTTPRFYVRVFRFAVDWCNLIDLAAIMPWYLTKVLGHVGFGGGFFISILRLMRVVRAFRLARRFEAVIIIMRSQRTSLRALYVLVLNLVLGMIIFWITDVLCRAGHMESRYPCLGAHR
jgi:hypothetical protein